MANEIVEGEIVSSGIPPESRLTKRDLKLLQRQEKAEQLVKMRLDIRRKWTYKEMAQEVGCSVSTVKRLLGTSMFRTLALAVREARMSPQVSAELLDREMPVLIERMIGIVKGQDGAEVRDSIEAFKALSRVAPALGVEIARFEEIEPRFRLVE